MKSVKEIILGFFTDKNGDGSSKRAILWLVVFVWISVIYANLFWGLSLEITLKVQLFSMLIVVITYIFGEQIGGWLKTSNKTNLPDEKNAGS